MRRLLLPLLLACAVLIGAFATAGAPDARGWATGTPAKNAAKVLGPLEKEVLLDLPEDLAKKVTKPTLLVYFSPTCPHCVAVAPELEALAARMKGHGQIIGVASGRSSDRDIARFTQEQGVTWEIVVDKTGAIAQELAVRSTPSAALVVPAKKGKQVQVVDFWYPYVRGFDLLVLMRVLPEPFAAFAPDEYVGTDACGACHVEEADSWALTHHSVAWNTLVKRDKQADPACTSCHVTGAGQPTGWSGDDPHSHLVTVGCEACHGPAGPHDGRATEASASCATCHDPKHSIGFTYAKALPHIDHYAATGMGDEAWSEARRKLHAGEVGQKMVGFDQGKTVGSAACKDCHAAEHAQWSASPHAAAMARLDAPSAAKAECVRCHATAVEAGMGAAEAVSAYRIAESVGCESCHGPGEAHVAAGGKAPIEGLGDDCPVCVVEALCTSCHTPEWDESWDLDVKLPKAGHGAR